MIYQNSAWRKITGFTLDPTGKPLDPVVPIKKGSINKGGQMNNSEKVRLMKTKPYGFKVEAVRKAMKGGMAFYLDTYIGCRKVTGIDADGSWVITGSDLQQRSWAICSTQVDRWYIQTLSSL